MKCQKPTNRINSIAKVPLHYNRFTRHYALGTKGKQYSFYTPDDFERVLNFCFEELWKVCPIGKADIILCAGIYVNKKNSRHCAGRAFDLDGIWWGDRFVSASNYKRDSIVYLGIESVLRQYFGTVLNYLYDGRHQDHWHIDMGTLVGYRPGSRSCSLYLQMTLRELFGENIIADGYIGSKTLMAARNVLNNAYDDEYHNYDIMSDSQTHQVLSANWIKYLRKCASIGLSALAPDEKAEPKSESEPKSEAEISVESKPADQTPIDLLNSIEEIITDNLSKDDARIQLSTALYSFIYHQDIAKILNPGN